MGPHTFQGPPCQGTSDAPENHRTDTRCPCWRGAPCSILAQVRVSVINIHGWKTKATVAPGSGRNHPPEGIWLSFKAWVKAEEGLHLLKPSSLNLFNKRHLQAPWPLNFRRC